MSLAADVYHELSLVGLAPPVPFVATDDRWREAILKAVGESDDLQTENEDLNQRNERLDGRNAELREQVRALESDLKNMTQERDRLAKATKKEAVSA